jgi:hypothetical protein
MKLDIRKKVEESKQDLICLKYTKHISTQDLQEARWKSLFDQYEELRDADSETVAPRAFCNL